MVQHCAVTEGAGLRTPELIHCDPAPPPKSTWKGHPELSEDSGAGTEMGFPGAHVKLSA